ncbi:MAG: hypothetical protein M3P50_13015 [Actinomycetota bacterium]|nr:hypothetical protein [Actinomycetota bacterium]
MNIQTEAAAAVQAQILFDSRPQVMQVQAVPAAAETSAAPSADGADVVLTLSAAARSLVTGG